MNITIAMMRDVLMARSNHRSAGVRSDFLAVSIGSKSATNDDEAEVDTELIKVCTACLVAVRLINVCTTRWASSHAYMSAHICVTSASRSDYEFVRSWPSLGNSRTLAFASVGLLFAANAFGDEQPAAPPTDVAAADSDDDDEPAKTKQRKKLELTARIFARSSMIKSGDEPTAAQSTLQSARGGFDFRAHGLRMQLELEVADRAKIKDAYVQLRLSDSPKLDVRAGNFKMPFSAIQLESIWTLPMADRGLVDNVLVKRLQVGGRAVGAMVSLDLGGPHHLRLRAGGFQGVNDAGDPLAATADDGFGHDAVVRASIRPIHGVEVGASGSVRSGALITAPVEIERAYAAELDLTVDLAAGPGRIRAWLEAMIGTSWLVGGMMINHDLTRFLEARGIVAYRFGGAAKRARYVEPYVLAAAIDPDRIVERDHVREAAVGITYGAADTWRVQLEAEVYRFGDNAPLGITELAVAPVDSLAFLLQLGARI